MIVIPMAGLSSRFKAAGFDQPKYMLAAQGATLFEHSVDSFSHYFSSERFIFIALNTQEIRNFIKKKCRDMGVENFEVVAIDRTTGGQAETVYIGLKKIGVSPEEPITIFNIDTFRPNFRYPEFLNQVEVDGYLETFIGGGKNWSNVVPISPGSGRVKVTAEKQELSEFCCTGLYYWNRAGDFIDLFEIFMQIPAINLQGSEYYIAPMYNLLIERGGDVRFSVVDNRDVIFCGNPLEYHHFSNKA